MSRSSAEAGTYDTKVFWTVFLSVCLFIVVLLLLFWTFTP
jgi:hypothetical protein